MFSYNCVQERTDLKVQETQNPVIEKVSKANDDLFVSVVLFILSGTGS